MSERTDIEEKVVNWFRKRGDIVIKNTLSRRKGWPDITVYLDHGDTLFWEFKLPLKKLSPIQEKTKRAIEIKGHTVFVAFSKEEALQQFEAWRKWREQE